MLPAAPGQYRPRVHPVLAPQPRRYRDYTVVVDPGQWVEPDYRAPLFTFSRGSLGPPPQSYNGIGAMIATA